VSAGFELLVFDIHAWAAGTSARLRPWVYEPAPQPTVEQRLEAARREREATPAVIFDTAVSRCVPLLLLLRGTAPNTVIVSVSPSS
jgi:hypothetical protein